MPHRCAYVSFSLNFIVLDFDVIFIISTMNSFNSTCLILEKARKKNWKILFVCIQSYLTFIMFTSYIIHLIPPNLFSS